MPESKVKKDMWHAPGASQGNIMEFQMACWLFEKHKTILLYHMSAWQYHGMNRVNFGNIMNWRWLRKYIILLRTTISAKEKRHPTKTSKWWKVTFRLRKRYLRSIALMSGCLDLQICAIQASGDSSLLCTLLADAITLAQYVLTNPFGIKFQSEINMKYGSLGHLNFLFVSTWCSIRKSIGNTDP